MYILYKTTNNITGDVYISVHITDDPSSRFIGKGYALQAALMEYGLDNFSHEKIGLYDDMNEMESILVAKGKAKAEVVEIPHPKPALGKKYTKKEKSHLYGHRRQTGKLNSQYGTRWVYHAELGQCKKIRKEELEEYLSNGWQRGRKRFVLK